MASPFFHAVFSVVSECAYNRYVGAAGKSLGFSGGLWGLGFEAQNPKPSSRGGRGLGWGWLLEGPRLSLPSQVGDDRLYSGRVLYWATVGDSGYHLLDDPWLW